MLEGQHDHQVPGNIKKGGCTYLAMMLPVLFGLVYSFMLAKLGGEEVYNTYIYYIYAADNRRKMTARFD